MSESDQDRAAREAAAKQRFFALGIVRLAGIPLIVFGFLLLMQRVSFLPPDKAKVAGIIFTVVGLFQSIMVPRMLTRAWRTPKQ